MVSLLDWLLDIYEQFKDWFSYQCQLYRKPFILYVLSGFIFEIANIPTPLEGTGSAFRGGIMPPMTSFQNFVFTITYINLWIVIFWIYFIRYNEKHKDD